MSASQDTDKVFAGAIPALYDRYLVPFLFKPFAEDIAWRLFNLRPGRVLEVAAGTGALTFDLAEAFPKSVEIVATDLNQPMLDFAAGKASPPNVVWQQADAQALPFDDGAFDAVVCQFGVMFFPDKPAAFREAHRVLKPGGRYPVQRLGRAQFERCGESDFGRGCGGVPERSAGLHRPRPARLQRRGRRSGKR